MTALTPAPSVTDTAVYIAREVGSDVAIFVSPEVVLVSSVSKPGTYRMVNILENTCTCEASVLGGYDYCHHRTTARIVAELDRREATPVEAPSYRCFRCGCIVEGANHDAVECPSCTRERLIGERGICPRCQKRPRGMLNARVLPTCCMCLIRSDDDA